MIRSHPSKLTPYITKLIGNSISLGLPYAFVIESVEIIYQTFNEWMNKGIQRNLGNIISFINKLSNRMLIEKNPYATAE